MDEEEESASDRKPMYTETHGLTRFEKAGLIRGNLSTALDKLKAEEREIYTEIVGFLIDHKAFDIIRAARTAMQLIALNKVENFVLDEANTVKDLEGYPNILRLYTSLNKNVDKTMLEASKGVSDPGAFGAVKVIDAELEWSKEGEELVREEENDGDKE